MYFEDLLKLSLSNIMHRRLRSFLTVLGIIIGIATVIALVSIGQGFQESITNQLSALGANTIVISPGHQRAAGGLFFPSSTFRGVQSSTAMLTENDVNTIKKIPGVLSADGIVLTQSTIQFNQQNASVSVIGVDPTIWSILPQIKLQAGRLLNSGDISSVVIGSRVQSGLFKKNVTLNSQIEIDGKNYYVVGILQQTGGIVGGFSDNSVIVLKSNARQIATNLASSEVSLILVGTTQNSDPNQVASLIEQRLITTHHVTQSTEDFTVISPQTIQSTVSTISSSITLFLGTIAAISLLVGSIGIANTMFTSVVERTRHIGVLKSLGMTSNEILKLFLIESSLIGLIGGLIGSVVGYGVAQIISVAVASANTSGVGFSGGGFGRIEPYVSPELILFAIGFSILIGAISGLLPARSAAKLQPVEALRYE